MEPPSFPTNGPRTVRTAPGDDTVLVLPLPSGSPPFQFEWSRAGAKLGDRFTSSNDAGGVRLTVSAARTSDSGVYTLQASNAAGKDTTRVRLEVSPEEMATGEDPPNFLRRLQDLTVKVGTRTRFLVEIVSSTECRVTWYRNERRLLEAERIALVRDGNFWCADISAVSVDDAGRWTCTAENVGGRASCSAHLNVLVPKAYKRPEFVEELRALLTEQGTVSLECKVVGVPTPVLRWFKDSREIKAGDVFALTANAEDPTSLGTYTCEAVNCMGRAYSSSKVHVVGRASREGSTRPTSDGVTPEPPPIFTKELEDHFVRICEPLTMSCNLVVPPWPRSVVWYNKEGKIEASERYHILEDGVGGYLLEVPSAEWPDEGEWKCVATSAGGRVGISTCYVSMDVPKNYRKPRFMENLQAVLTEEGLVSFECKVVGFPTPVLSWFKDGQELKPGDVYQLTGTNSLGSYCCIARNCMGQASSSAELTVEDIQNQLNEEEKLQLFSKNQAPKFLQGLKSVEAKIDEPFRFTIKVAIPPEPTVLWYRDDQPVDESSRCHHGKEGRGVSFLDIQNLEFMDQAEWKCVAMNDYGHSITSCFLKLIIPRHYKKPRFLENLQAILSDEGAVNLECKVIGVPQPVLKWYKDGEELKPGDIHKIISGQDGTCCLGTYTCEAQNCMGIAASSASLLGFEDSMRLKNKKKADEQQLQRNLSLSTIHEERTSQMYDTPVGDITLDERGEISFSFDGKEVSVSLYETPDLTEEEALQIVEMYADQLSENVTEHNVVELPPLRFVKETSTSGNLLMEAIIIDVSPEYFTSPEEDLRTEADIEDISIVDENGPPQLSLDQDVDGEDYLEKTIAIISEEKADIPKKMDRKKSDSQKSGDDYFSLSRDQSISDEKKDDDTQPLSGSELQSFASARSSGKPKSKSSKPSVDDGQESSEITKTVLLVEDLQKQNIEGDNTLSKNSQQRRRSRSSRRSSSGSEKSLNKLKENVIEVKLETEDITKEVFINQEKIKSDITRINSSLTKVINDIQIVERDTILKSELMSTTATASRSLEIINSLLTPISEINSITEVISEMINEPSQVIIPMFKKLSQPLENLQKSLTVVGKCIDVESENKTLVKKTAVSIIERCGSDLDSLMKDIQIIHKECHFAENVETSTLENITAKLISNINDLVNIVNKVKNQNGEIDNDDSEKAKEFNHLKNTQKAVHGLKYSLKSLLDIIKEVNIFEPTRFNKVKKIDIILNDMSIPIHDLQTALEHIEGLSIQETKSNLHKYNTEIIETIMDPILQLRTSFKELSGEVAEKESIDELNQILIAIKLNINKLFLHIDDLELKIGKFDILNSDNKMEVLQKMAQILITLENNLPLLETVPIIKSHMSEFHKNLTKILENVIESDDREQYLCLLEICEAINRINSSIKCIDSSSEISLANLRNTFKIVNQHLNKNIFHQDLNQATSSIITNAIVSIDTMYNRQEKMTTDGLNLETVQDLIINKDTERNVNIILEHIEQTIAAWSSITPHETAKEFLIIETFNKICPILEDLKFNLANSIQEAEKYENASDLDSLSYKESIAVQLCELHQAVNVLNHIFYENTDDQERSQLIGEYGKPLLELSTALQILQQDIISQCKENESYLNIMSTIANVLESLQSCIVIQEQQLIEAADDMSTLEDISGIKSTAEIISSSDVYATATTAETTSKEFTEQFLQLLSSTSLQTLQQINNQIMRLKNSDVLEVFDLVSNLNDYSISKYIFTELKPISSHVQEVYETSGDIPPVITSSLISEIVQPLEELEQKLSVIDISNIKSLENVSENTKEKLNHVADNVLILKNNIRESLDIVKPIVEFADFMIVVSNKISNLRVTSEKLIYITDQMMTKVSNTSNDNLIKLKHSLSNFLKSTNYPFEIKIPQIKEDIKNLYNTLIIGQDELIKFTAPKSECLAEETTVIDMINDIEDNILTLHEYNFVDVSHNLDSLYATKPLNVIEVEMNSILQVNYDIENTLKNIHSLSHDLLNDQIIIVKDFCETFKNEMTILRALIKKPSSSKRLIKLLQVFFALSNRFKDFKNRLQETGLPENINKCLSIFIADTEECLTHLQLFLLEAIENKSHILFDTPVSNINNIEASLAIILQSSDQLRHHSLINKFLNIVRAIQPCFENLQSSVIKELYLSPIRDSEFTSMEVEAYKEYEIFTTFILEELNNIMRDDDQKDIYEQILNVVRKHESYERAIGSGKILIFIKCISECCEIFKEKLEMIHKAEELKEKSSDGSLRMNIADINNYLENVYIQLQEVQKQHLSCTEKPVVSLKMKSIKQIDEISKYFEKNMDCDNLSLNNSDISTLMELDNKLHLIRKTLSCLESTSSFETLKVLFNPIEEIERILNKLLGLGNLLEEKNRILKEKKKSLLQHMEQYIEIIEIVEEVSAVIKLDDLKESANIVRELRQSIEISEKIDINEPSLEKRNLTQKLQKALISLQSQAFENLQEFAPTIHEDIRQQIIEVVTDLQNDLVALTGTNIFVEENIPTLKREQENIDEDKFTEDVFANDIKTSDREVINEVENNTTIVNDKDQTNLNEIEQNVVESVTIPNTSVTKEERSGADMLGEAQNIEENISLHSKDAESLTLISDISHETIKDTPHKKSVTITDVLLNHLEKYISDDAVSTIKKLSPPLRSEHLEYTIKLAKQLLDCTDTTISEDSSLQTGLSGFSVEQLELALSMYESLSIMFKTIFEQPIDFEDLISKEEFENVKTVVSNLRATLQIIITSVKTSLDVEMTTDIQKQDLDVREHEEEKKSQKAGVSTFTFDEMIFSEVQNLPTSESIITDESKITAGTVVKEYADNLIEIKTLKAEVFDYSEKLSEANTNQKLILDNVIITETPDVSYIDGKISIIREKVTKDTLIDQLDEYIREETLKALENLLPPLNLENIHESIQIAHQLHEATIIEEDDDLHLSKTQLHLALKLEKIICPISEIVCVKNTVINEVSEYEQIKKSQATISNLQKTLKTLITLTKSHVDELLDPDEVKDLVIQEPVDYQLIINEEKLDLIPPALTSTENVYQGDDTIDLLQIENTEDLNKYVAKFEEISIGSKSNLDKRNNTNIMEEILTTTTIEDLKDTTSVLQPNDEDNLNSLEKLLKLFQDASNTIDLSSETLCVDSSENLQNTLDEVQTIIMELKCECVGSMKDAFNETLEDLECNVRSVLLQINEHSPSIQLKEACANLQSVAAYLYEIGDTVNIETKSSNTLCDYNKDAENTIELLESASSLKGDKTMESIISNLNNIKDTMKFLRSSFLSDEETLILRGIEVIQSLDSIEDRIFCLEKDIEAQKDIDPIARDSIISAVHSVYGSISNMRGAVSSIQKKYMYENYGNPSRKFLQSIKHSMTISNYDNNKYWKDCAKAIRKVLNHFEDIKFYINLDKTARLPSDAAFTKIILTELYTMVSGVNQLHISHLDKDVRKRVQNCLDSVNEHLTALENRTTLEVKDKIPIFKNVSENILDFTHFLKNIIEKEVTKELGGSDNTLEINLIDILDHSVSKETQVVHDIELNKEEQNEITKIEEQLDQVTDTVKDMHQEKNNLKNTSITETVLESNEILQKQETPILKNEQEISSDIKVDENDRNIKKEISEENFQKKKDSQITESVDCEDKISHGHNKEIKDTENIQEDEINQTKLIHENLSDKKEEIVETSAHSSETENNKMDSCNIEMIERGSLDYSYHKNEENINNRDLGIESQKEDDSKLNEKNVLENEIEMANNEITEQGQNDSTQLESSIEKEGECTVIELDLRKSVNIESKTDKEEQNCMKLEENASELTKPIEKQQDRNLKLEEQYKDEKLEPKEESKIEIPKSIEKREESKLQVEDQYKNEKLEINEDGKVETEKSIGKQEENKLKGEDQYIDEKLEIKDDGQVEAETSFEKQKESNLKLEEQHKDEKLETKNDNKVETTKSLHKQEGSKPKLEDQNKDDKLEIRDDSKEKLTTSIEKQDETTNKLGDQHKDDKLEIRDDSKEKLTTSIEKQDETTNKLGDQHKDDKLEMKNVNKVETKKSLEKQEESKPKLEDQHKDEKLEMKNDNKVETTKSLEKREESKPKLEDQLKGEKLEMKDDSKENLTTSTEKKDEPTNKLGDQHKDDKLEMKNDNKVDTTKSLEKREESKPKLEDQLKDEKLETKNDNKVETIKSLEKQEESKPKLKDQLKDEKLETKNDNKVETIKSLENQEESKPKLEDQLKDEKLETKNDNKVETIKSLEKQEGSKPKLEDHHKDKKLEIKDDSKEKLTTSIEKQDETTNRLGDQHKDDELEMKNDNKVETTKSLEKQEESKRKLEDQTKDEKLELKDVSKEKLTTSIEKQDETTNKLGDQRKDDELEMKNDNKVETTKSLEKQEESKPKLEDQLKDEKLETKNDNKVETIKSLEKQEESKPKLEDHHKDKKLEIKDDSKEKLTTSIEKQDETTNRLGDQHKDDELEMKNDNKVETIKSLEKQEESKPKLEDQLKDEKLETKNDNKVETIKSLEKQEESKSKLEDHHKDKKLEIKDDSKEKLTTSIEKQDETTNRLGDQHKDNKLEMKNDNKVEPTKSLEKQEESKPKLEDQTKDEKLELKDVSKEKLTTPIEKQDETTNKLGDQHKDDELEMKNDNKVETTKSLEKQEEGKPKLEDLTKDEKLEMKDVSKEKLITSIEKQEETTNRLGDQHKDDELEMKNDNKVETTKSLEKQEEGKPKLEDLTKDEKLEMKDVSKEKLTTLIEKQEETTNRLGDQHKDDELEMKNDNKVETTKSLEKQEEGKPKLEDQTKDEKLEMKDVSKEKLTTSIQKQGETTHKFEDQHKDEKLETKNDKKVETTKSLEKQEESKPKLEDQLKDEKLETKNDNKVETTKSLEKQEEGKPKLEDLTKDEKLEMKDVSKEKLTTLIEKQEETTNRLGDQHKDDELEMKNDNKVETTKSLEKQEEGKPKLEDQTKDEKLEMKDVSKEKLTTSIEKQDETTNKLGDQRKDDELEMKNDNKVETTKSLEKQEESKSKLEDHHKDKKLQIKDDSKEKLITSIEKQEETTNRLGDQHKDDELEMKNDNKVETTKSLEKQEEGKPKLEDQTKDEKLEMKDVSKEKLTTLIEKQDETSNRLGDQHKVDELEMKNDNKVETTKSLEKQEESKPKLEDQLKDEKLETKNDNKVETIKSLKKQEESKPKLEDHHKDKKLEIKDDSKEKLTTSIEKQDETTNRLGDQHKDDELEMKNDNKKETTKSLEKQEESKPKLEDQTKDEKLELKDVSKEKLTTSIEKQDETTNKLGDQRKDDELEMKNDNKVETTKSLEKQEESKSKLEDHHKDKKLQIKDDSKEKLITSIEKQEETTNRLGDQHKDDELEMKNDNKVETTKSLEKQEEGKPKLEDQTKDEKLEMKDVSKEKLTTLIEKQDETSNRLGDQHKVDELEMKNDNKVETTKSLEKQEESKPKLEDQTKDEKLELKDVSKEKLTTSIEKQDETTNKLGDQHKDEKLETKNDKKVETTKSLEKQEESKPKLEDQLKDEKLEIKEDSKEKLKTTIKKQDETTNKLGEQHKDDKLETKNDNKVETTKSLEKQEESKPKLEDQLKDENPEMKDVSKEKLTTSIEKQEETTNRLGDQHKDDELEMKNDNKVETTKSLEKQEEGKPKLEDQTKDEKLEMKDVSKEKLTTSIQKQGETTPKFEDQHKDEKLKTKNDNKVETTKSLEKQEESKPELENQHKDEKLETKENNNVETAKSIEKLEKSQLKLEDEHKDYDLERKEDNKEMIRKSIEKRKENNFISDKQHKDEKLEIKEDSKEEVAKCIKKQEDINLKSENQNKDKKLETKDERKIDTPKSIKKEEESKPKLRDQQKENMRLMKKDSKEEISKLNDKQEESEVNLEDKHRDKKLGIKIEVKKDSIIELDQQKIAQLKIEKKIEENIRTIPSAENIMDKINEKEVSSRQKTQSKVNSEFIECTKPDYSLEFTKPPTYISKTFELGDTVSQIKTNNQIPTMYKAQTLLYESQLRSSLPPYQRSSEGRTEMKDITKAVSESRNTLSEKRTGVARDSRRKPVFSTYLTDRTAVEGSRVKLTCSILSASDPTISWYKNGAVLDSKQKFRSKFVDGLITLEVLNAIPSDSGEYSCTVQNENGSITSSANLKVYPSFEASPIPPTFTRSIRDSYHLADNELVLECRIRGQPLPAIIWLKNGETVMLNERIQSHYLADGVCRLTISSPTSGDSGKYTCKAENSVWSDQISHEVYFAGADSVCPRVGTMEKIHLNRQAMESRRPHFTNVLTDHRVVSGGTIGLQVEIRGDPTRVEWLREGRSVTELYRNAQTYVDHDIYTLALTDVTEKESGLYTCRAWSSHGNVDMNASITVVQPNLIEGKPATIVSRPAKDLLISVGEDINISFRVRGEPKPKVFFMKGIRDITNSLRVCKMTSDDYVKFTLKRSVISDAGTYCIFARNAYGCDRAFVTVVVRQRASSDSLISDWMYPMDDLAISSVERNYKSVPDRIPSEPSVVDGGNNWISLAWSKPNTQVKAPILAYKIECWKLGKEGGARWTELGITPRNSYDAFNLKQGEEYHFRVTPRNRYGWGESVQTSAPIGIGLAGDRPEFTEILPGQLKVLLGESAVLGCNFKGIPTPEIVWMKNGHEIEEEKDRVRIVVNNLNTSLHINEVKIEDEGRYSCEATNIHGRSSTYARMAVITDRHIWEADAKLKRERSAGIDGEYPPQFTMRLRDRRVQVTYPVRLTCQVVGNPPPILTWFKNGIEISSDGRHITSQDECFHTLEIAPTTLEDGGVYEAMARNCYGAISCRCSLVVDKGIRAYIAPEFCCGLEPLYHLSEGDELRISAVVEAYPSVGVTWYRDGVRLRSSRRAIMTLDRDGQIELALASVTGRDAGVYTCTASNEVGRASTSGMVEVVSDGNIVEKSSVPPIVISPDVPYSKEPLFIRKPRSSEAHEGDTVIIECEVIGDPKPDVYWLRDFLKPDYYRDASHFRRVGAGPAYRFEIPHAKFDYTGAYSIIAKNIHGEAKAIISLQILAKDPSAVDDAHNIRFGRVEVIPHIEKELTDLLCYDGDAVEFDCRISGNPEPDIRWFHYNEIVPDCPDFESSYDLGIARLKIKQVTAEDEGTYSCEASNSMGKVTSSACLVVYPPGEPNTLSQQLRRPTGLLSAASTPRSTPRSTPARSKSRTPGPDLRRLRSPTREVAPKFYTYPYNKVAEEGETIVFQCAVKGLPPPWATWDKDGIIITPSARFNIKEKDETFKILEIEQVTIEDVGLYRITLENDYGRTEASARLEVITQKGKFYGTTRSYSVSPRKSLSYRRRTPSFSKQD